MAKVFSSDPGPETAKSQNLESTDEALTKSLSSTTSTKSTLEAISAKFLSTEFAFCVRVANWQHRRDSAVLQKSIALGIPTRVQPSSL